MTVNSGGELLLNGVALGNALSLNGLGVGAAGAVATTGATVNSLNGSLALAGITQLTANQ